MMLLAESEAETPEPEQGVIEEARRRKRSRHLRRASATLASLAALAAGISAALILTGRGTKTPEGRSISPPNHRSRLRQSFMAPEARLWCVRRRTSPAPKPDGAFA